AAQPVMDRGPGRFSPGGPGLVRSQGPRGRRGGPGGPAPHPRGGLAAGGPRRGAPHRHRHLRGRAPAPGAPGPRGVGRAAGDGGRRRACAHAPEAAGRGRSSLPGRAGRRGHTGGSRQMELTNEFTVGVPVERAWQVLTDVEGIAPCMPGAELQEVAGDEYRGIVKVKVGPITAQYKGAARFVELDERGRRAVLRAEGRDTRGQGNANATITATLVPDDDGTRVSVLTDLAVTGRVAQFGRGVLADVSAKLLGQFVNCLESTVLVEGGNPGHGNGSADNPAGDGASGGASGGGSGGGSGGASALASVAEPARAGSGEPGRTTSAEPRAVLSSPKEPVDLLDAGGAAVAKRALPALAAAVVLLWLIRRLRG